MAGETATNLYADLVHLYWEAVQVRSLVSIA